MSGSVVLLCFVTAVTAGASLEAASVEEAIPSQSSFALATDNLAAALLEARRTELGQVLTGAPFAAIRQAAIRSSRGSLFCLRPWFGCDWEDLAAWNGKAALMVFPAEQGTSGVAWVFALPAAGESAPRPMTAAAAYCRAQGAEEKRWKRGDVSLTTFTFRAHGQPGGQPTWFQTPSFFGVADSPTAATALLAHVIGPEKSALAANGECLEVLRESGLTADSPTAASSIRWWLRPIPLWSAVDRESGERAWLAMARRQGGEAVHLAGGTVSFLPEGLWEVRGAVLIRRPLNKAAALLNLQEAPSALRPSWLGSDLVSLTTWGWKTAEALDGWEQLFDDLNEPGLFQEMLAALREDPEGPQVDLRRDLFPHLGPAFLRVSDARGEATATDPQGRREMFVVQCRDSAKVSTTLARFYQDDDQVRHTTLGKCPLWTVGKGHSLFAEGSDGTIGQIRAVMVTEKELLLSSDPEMLESRLASDAPVDAEWVRWHESPLEPQAVFRSYTHLGGELDGPYNQVRALGAQPRENWPLENWRSLWLQWLLTGSSPPPADFPFDQLPPYSQVTGALPALRLEVVNTKVGWRLALQGHSKTTSPP